VNYPKDPGNLPTINNKIKLIKTIREISGCSLLAAKTIAEHCYRSKQPDEQTDQYIDDHNEDRLARKCIESWRKDNSRLGEMYYEVRDTATFDPEILLDFGLALQAMAVADGGTTTQPTSNWVCVFICDFIARKNLDVDARDIAKHFNEFKKSHYSLNIWEVRYDTFEQRFYAVERPSFD
jgi:hypothetical protein